MALSPDEIWYKQEVSPPPLIELGRKLVDFFGIPPSNVGIKGNLTHLRGYHRSFNWILNSRYCTNRSYSVSETVGNRHPFNPDWCCALDLTLPQDQLIEVCQRLDRAVRAGLLEKITEWYGNDDGDNRVDGYDNIRNVVATSDSSHLFHLHMSWDRGHVNENHDDVFQILTGTGEDMTPEQAWVLHVINWRTDGIVNGRDPITVPARPDLGHDTGLSIPNLLWRELKKIEAAGLTESELDKVVTAASTGAEAGVDKAFDGATVTTTIDTTS